jgi:2-polyprenyl-3-methyl-5-hydroxy-6-metoxy-1,4-benzoquinol methylase
MTDNFQSNSLSVSPRYGWTGKESAGSHDYIIPALLGVLVKEKVSRVLDLGCGNGSLCCMLTSHGFDMVGMEPDIDGFRIASEQLPSTSFYRLGVDDDPQLITSNEGLFDAVLSTEVIEHLFFPQLLPRFAWKCLKPGGILIITTPYHGYLKNIALSVAGKWDHHHTALWHGGHIKFWSRNTLTKLLVDEGFCVERFAGVGRFPWLWKSMILSARKSHHHE